jgi:hypothetical protein
MFLYYSEEINSLKGYIQLLHQCYRNFNASCNRCLTNITTYCEAIFVSPHLCSYQFVLIPFRVICTSSIGAESVVLQLVVILGPFPFFHIIYQSGTLFFTP